MASQRLAMLMLAAGLLALAQSRKLSEQDLGVDFSEEEDPADPEDDQSMNDAFVKFKGKFGKRYKNKRDEDKARSAYKEGVKFVSEHNRRYATGEETYKMAINEYADMSFEDFEKNLMGARIPDESTFSRASEAPRNPKPKKHAVNVEHGRRKRQEDSPPSSLDWTPYSITPVRNQAHALEGRASLYYDITDMVSEQSLVDCAVEPEYDNVGCAGGWPYFAYNYLKAAGGANGVKTYPYTGKDLQQCKFVKAKSIPDITVTGLTILPRDESQLLLDLWNNGPLTVAIKATQRFTYYTGVGVFNDPDCSGMATHVVTLVGYGTDEHTGEDYWIIKNSWGNTWGLAGYMRIARNKNMCRIADFAVSPTIF